jgi:hypothetical protein
MPAGQNHSNFALNTRLSAPRYDAWCKIQVLELSIKSCFQEKKLRHRKKFWIVLGHISHLFKWQI